MSQMKAKSTKELPIETIRELIDYDEQAGLLTWKLRESKWFKSESRASAWNNRWAGKPALNTLMIPSRGARKGYLGGHILYEKMLAHRVAFAHFHGHWPDLVIDHINGDTSDNRICNLRQATYQQNSMNRERSANNTSGYANIQKTKSGRFSVYMSIGVYDTIDQARDAYRSAARHHHGEFALIDD